MAGPALEPWVRAILRCPACGGTLADRGPERLACTAPACALVYPVRSGIPVLLVDEAVAPGPTPQRST